MKISLKEQLRSSLWGLVGIALPMGLISFADNSSYFIPVVTVAVVLVSLVSTHEGYRMGFDSGYYAAKEEWESELELIGQVEDVSA